MDRLKNVISEIDRINSEDPNHEYWQGEKHPKEVLYSQRMTEMLGEYTDKPSEEMQIAARGQHIRRWHIPRSDYPMDRKGYLKWRTMLKLYHGELLGEIMQKHGYDAASIEQVVTLVTKKKLKNDPDSQQLEDVVCLVFLKYYFHEFARQHNAEKIVDIVQKTWGKMTEKGHDMALTLDYLPEDLSLIQKALAG